MAHVSKLHPHAEIYHRDNIKLNDESVINISTHENS